MCPFRGVFHEYRGESEYLFFFSFSFYTTHIVLHLDFSLKMQLEDLSVLFLKSFSRMIPFHQSSVDEYSGYSQSLARKNNIAHGIFPQANISII